MEHPGGDINKTGHLIRETVKSRDLVMKEEKSPEGHLILCVFAFGE